MRRDKLCMSPPSCGSTFSFPFLPSSVGSYVPEADGALEVLGQRVQALPPRLRHALVLLRLLVLLHADALLLLDVPVLLRRLDVHASGARAGIVSVVA